MQKLGKELTALAKDILSVDDFKDFCDAKSNFHLEWFKAGC